jgi:endonuclease G
MESLRRDVADNLDAEESKYDYESDLEFVAGGKGYDSCNGDSGGPAYIIVDGVRKVAGLTSRATRGATTACGQGGIYTRVDVHLNFIESLIP